MPVRMPEGPRYERLNDSEESMEEISESQTRPSLGTAVIRTETSNVETESMGSAPTESPPPYSPSDGGAAPVPTVQAESPPQYSEVVKLPSYEEVESSHRESRIQRYFGFGSVTANSDCDDTDRLGNDFGFILCFILAFLMNWLGFVVGYCFTNTLASHYGALSGFGLSMVKWAFIIRHASCCRDYLMDQPWLMWLFAIFGWLIFIRGALSYLQLKRLSRLNEQVQVLGWGI